MFNFCDGLGIHEVKNFLSHWIHVPDSQLVCIISGAWTINWDIVFFSRIHKPTSREDDRRRRLNILIISKPFFTSIFVQDISGPLPSDRNSNVVNEMCIQTLTRNSRTWSKKDDRAKRLVSRLCVCLWEEMSAVKKYFATHDLRLSARISVKRNIALDRPPNWPYIVCDKRGFEC